MGLQTVTSVISLLNDGDRISLSTVVRNAETILSARTPFRMRAPLFFGGLRMKLSAVLMKTIVFAAIGSCGRRWRLGAKLHISANLLIFSDFTMRVFATQVSMLVGTWRNILK